MDIRRKSTVADLQSGHAIWQPRNALRDFLPSPMYICLSRAICGAISSIATNVHSSDDKLCHFKLVNNHLWEQSLSINIYDVLAVSGAAEEVEMFCFFGDECRAVFAEDRGGRIGIDHNIEHLFLAIFV